MKVIILAYENENHTHCVKWALEETGYQVACWAGLSWVEPQQASLLLDRETKLELARHRVEPGDVIWIRRPDQPLPNPKVSEADRKFAELEYRSFYYCIGYMLEMLPVWCINKFSAARFIHNKAVQLHLARSCGLKIPRTLMSNCPARIGGFVNHNPGKTIGKGFSPHVWQRDEGVSVTQTFELTPERLPSDEVLTFAPAIYQDRVVKQFDVRMVVMGQRLYSYALHHPRKALDWRQDSALGNLRVEIIPTPPDIEKRVLAFTQKAGICFGSIDFAVDMDGQWWFLEINEEGQFLWLDQLNPQARILEKFCAFITAPQSSTQPLEEREGLFPPFAEYLKFYRSLGESRQATDVAAAVAASPYMSREAS
jgi:hypothetical protein